MKQRIDLHVETRAEGRGGALTPGQRTVEAVEREDQDGAAGGPPGRGAGEDPRLGRETGECRDAGGAQERHGIRAAEAVMGVVRGQPV